MVRGEIMVVVNFHIATLDIHSQETNVWQTTRITLKTIMGKRIIMKKVLGISLDVTTQKNILDVNMLVIINKTVLYLSVLMPEKVLIILGKPKQLVKHENMKTIDSWEMFQKTSTLTVGILGIAVILLVNLKKVIMGISFVHNSDSKNLRSFLTMLFAAGDLRRYVQ